MNAPGRYIVLDRRDCPANLRPRLQTSLDGLRSVGWTQRLELDGLEVWTPAGSALPVVQVHRRHLLIGDYHGTTTLSALCGLARDAGQLARSVIGSGWGRYVLIFRDADDVLRLLRDPTGALDAVHWVRDGLTVVTDAPVGPLDPLLPPQIEIAWDGLARIASDVAWLAFSIPLIGLSTAIQGAMTTPRTGDVLPVWTPGAAARRPNDDPSADALAAVIDRTVETLLRARPRVLAELSGGLDSAIVAAAVRRAGAAPSTTFLNYHPDQAEGDERGHARAVAAWLDLPLTEIAKPPARLDLDTLALLGLGFRPALHGLDLAYEADVADRLTRSGATGLLTGQGGDALFFQAPDPAVLRDRCLRLGPFSIGPRRLGAVAGWIRRPAFHILSLAWGWTPSGPRLDVTHPWLSDIEDLPPAKRGQIQRFTNAQMFWTDCSRSRAADLLHPLLSQPVADHCLALPSDHLVSPQSNMARDRALARQAYAGRLPPDHLARRDKGDLSRFYGDLVRDNRRQILDILADKAWTRHLGLSRAALEHSLSPEVLVSDTRSNRFLAWCAIQTWVDHWQDRIDRLRRQDIVL